MRVTLFASSTISGWLCPTIFSCTATCNTLLECRLRRFRVVGNQVVSRALVERQCRWRLAAGSACITVLPRAEPVLLLQIGPAAVKGHHFRSGRHAGGFG